MNGVLQLDTIQVKASFAELSRYRYPLLQGELPFTYCFQFHASALDMGPTSYTLLLAGKHHFLPPDQQYLITLQPS